MRGPPKTKPCVVIAARAEFKFVGRIAKLP